MDRHKVMRVSAVDLLLKKAIKKVESRIVVKADFAGSVCVTVSSAVKAPARVRAVRMFKRLYSGIDYSALVREDGFPVCF